MASPTGTRSSSPVRADLVALGDLEVVAEDDDADRVLFEVEGQAAHAGAGELDHLAGHDAGQAVDAGDAVADLEHPADLARCRGWCWNLLDFLSRTETISSALNLMAASLDELVPDVARRGPDRAVVDVVAHLDDQAAQQVGIDRMFEDRFGLQRRAQFGRSDVPLVVGQGARPCAHMHAHATGAARSSNLADLGQDRPQQVEAVVVVEDQQEVHEDLAGPSVQALANQFILGGPDRWPASRAAAQSGRDGKTSWTKECSSSMTSSILPFARRP